MRPGRSRHPPLPVIDAVGAVFVTPGYRRHGPGTGVRNERKPLQNTPVTFPADGRTRRALIPRAPPRSRLAQDRTTSEPRLVIE